MSHAWILGVACPACSAQPLERCHGETGRQRAPHAARRNLAKDQGLEPATSSTFKFDVAEAARRARKVDEVEVLALADKLKFAHVMAGDPFYMYVARRLIELGFQL